MKAYNQEFHTKELLQFFAKHPGMMATMAYALLTLCGVIYSNAFYAKLCTVLHSSHGYWKRPFEEQNGFIIR